MSFGVKFFLPARWAEFSIVTCVNRNTGQSRSINTMKQMLGVPWLVVACVLNNWIKGPFNWLKHPPPPLRRLIDAPHDNYSKIPTNTVKPPLSGHLRDLPKCPLNKGCKNCASFVNDQHSTVTLYCDKLACCQRSYSEFKFIAFHYQP